MYICICIHKYTQDMYMYKYTQHDTSWYETIRYNTIRYDTIGVHLRYFKARILRYTDLQIHPNPVNMLNE